LLLNPVLISSPCTVVYSCLTGCSVLPSVLWHCWLGDRKITSASENFRTSNPKCPFGEHLGGDGLTRVISGKNSPVKEKRNLVVSDYYTAAMNDVGSAAAAPLWTDLRPERVISCWPCRAWFTRGKCDARSPTATSGNACRASTPGFNRCDCYYLAPAPPSTALARFLFCSAVVVFVTKD